MLVADVWFPVSFYMCFIFHHVYSLKSALFVAVPLRCLLANCGLSSCGSWFRLYIILKHFSTNTFIIYGAGNSAMKVSGEQTGEDV